MNLKEIAKEVLNIEAKTLFDTNIDDGFIEAINIIENTNFDIKDKEFIVISGQSGSGKSTLLHILSSFLKPNQGSVKYNNKDIYQISQKELTNLRKNFIGLIFQQHYLLEDLVLMKILR